MIRGRLLYGLAAALVAGGVLVGAQGAVPEIAFDTNADLLRTPNDVFVGEVGGVGANSKGQIFVYTRTGHPYATLGDNRTFYRGGAKLFQFDPVRQVRPRARPGRLRLQRRLRPAHRSAGQRLDHRRRRQPGGEVRRRGSRRAGARAQA